MQELNYLGYKALSGRRTEEEDRYAKEILDELYGDEEATKRATEESARKNVGVRPNN